MLRHQIIMADDRSLGQAGSTTTKEPCSRGLLRGFQIVEPHPVLLPMGQKFPPRPHPCRCLLTQHVKDPDIAQGDIVLSRGHQERHEDLRLRDEELCFGGLDMVRELELRVGRVGTGEDAASADDSQDEHGVEDLFLSIPIMRTNIDDVYDL